MIQSLLQYEAVCKPRMNRGGLILYIKMAIVMKVMFLYISKALIMRTVYKLRFSIGVVSLLTLSGAAGQASGCGQAPPHLPGTSKNYTLTVDVPREYTLFLPSSYSNYNTNHPLIFSFHGNGKSDWQQEQLSQFDNPDWNSDFIVVYPQGIDVHPLA
jgi:poly(3-hydroxybutyrate) depolymerase